MVVGAVGPYHHVFSQPDEERDDQWWMGVKYERRRLDDEGLKDPLAVLTKMSRTVEADVEYIAEHALEGVVYMPRDASTTSGAENLIVSLTGSGETALVVGRSSEDEPRGLDFEGRARRIGYRPIYTDEKDMPSLEQLLEEKSGCLRCLRARCTACQLREGHSCRGHRRSHLNGRIGVACRRGGRLGAPSKPVHGALPRARRHRASRDSACGSLRPSAGQTP